MLDLLTNLANLASPHPALSLIKERDKGMF